jgi:hypothetical protein
MESGQAGAGVPLDDNRKQRMILRLVARLRCVECGRFYAPEDIALIHRWQDLWVLSTKCQHCDETCHVLVFMRLDADPAPIQDLTLEEAQAADQWPAITADDVMDVHTFLRTFDGDFETLFAS